MAVIKSAITYRVLKNLATQELEELRSPAEDIVDQLSDYGQGEKNNWSNVSFEGYFITLVKPEDPTKRPSHDNPGILFGGIVVDIDDAHVSMGSMKRHIEKVVEARYLPQFISRSYSTGFHLHYEFDREIPVCGKEAYSKFISTFISKAGLKSLPGTVDMAAVTSPHHVFEIGRDWSPIRKRPVSNTVLLSLREMIMAATRNRWQYSKDKDVPIAKIRSILSEKYPHAGIVWEDFEPGQRYHRFYDPEADNVTACRIYTNGIYNWSGTDGFMPWSDRRLCGIEAVGEVLDTLTAQAVEDIYQEGKVYWRNINGVWETETLSSIKIALKSKGLTAIPVKGETISAMESGLELINQTQRVRGSGPCLFRKPGPIRTNGGSLFLNTSDVQAIRATKGKVAWGEGFPRVAEFFETCFRPEVREHMLLWVAHAYHSATNGFPCRGLGMLMIGPPGVGKNFFARGILGNLFGGAMDPQAFLLGTDAFNMQAFAKPIWYLSDIPNDLGRTRGRAFADNLKKTLADDTVRARAMFTEATEITWHGRLIIACNSDSSSLDALPHTGSLYDKMSYVETTPGKMDFYPSDEQLITEELPSFAAYLRDMVIPDELKCGRFGILPFHDPSLQPIVEAGDLASDRDHMIIRVIHMMATQIKNGGDEFPQAVTASDVYEFAKTFPSGGFQASFQSTFPGVAVLGRTIAKVAKSDPRIERDVTGRVTQYVVDFPAMLAGSGHPSH
jgi:hypothetical protein